MKPHTKTYFQFFYRKITIWSHIQKLKSPNRFQKSIQWGPKFLFFLWLHNLLGQICNAIKSLDWCIKQWFTIKILYPNLSFTIEFTYPNIQNEILIFCQPLFFSPKEKIISWRYHMRTKKNHFSMTQKLNIIYLFWLTENIWAEMQTKCGCSCFTSAVGCLSSVRWRWW